MMKRILLATLVFTPTSAALATPQTAPGDVVGTWQTAILSRPAPDGSMAYLRTMTAFTEERQELVVSIYADAGRQAKLFEYASGGPWTPQGPAAGVPGAMAIDMVNDYSRVTIFVDAPSLWASMNLGECPLMVGEAVEISGCVTGPPFAVTACTDLDIVMVDQNGMRLRYGGGSEDRCTTRPTDLSTDAFLRVD